MDAGQTSAVARLILKYILEQGERPLPGAPCIVISSVSKIAHGTQSSRRQVFRVLNALQRAKQLQRIQGIKIGYKSVFHVGEFAYHPEATYSGLRCTQVAVFRARYRQGAILSSLLGEQIPLFGTPIPEWVPTITDEELRWRADELRLRIGLPMLEDRFALKAS